MASQRLFGENQFAIDDNFKFAAAGRYQFPRAKKGFNLTFVQDFGCQTDNARCVISNRAVFNGDIQQGVLHDALLTVLLYT